MPQGSQVFPLPEGPWGFPLHGPHWRRDSSLPFANCVAVDPCCVVLAPEAAGAQCLDHVLRNMETALVLFLRIFQKEFCCVLVRQS